MSFKIDDILNLKNSTTSSTSSSASSVSSCSPIAVECSNLPKRSFINNAFYQTIYPHFDMFKSNIFTSNQIQSNIQTRPSSPNEFKNECKTQKADTTRLNKTRNKKKREKNQVKCEECSGNCVDITSSKCRIMVFFNVYFMFFV